MNRHHVKVLLLGHQGVGKSSIERRYVTGTIKERPKSTLSWDFTTKDIDVDNLSIVLDIWDTWGQERFGPLGCSYYRGLQAAVVVYDITKADTYDRALEWREEVRKNCDSERDGGDVVVALVGNKVDLAETSRAVLTEDVRSYASENSMLFGETSAKTGEGIDDLFMKVAREVANRFDLEAMTREREAFRLSLKRDGGNNEKGYCC